MGMAAMAMTEGMGTDYQHMSMAGLRELARQGNEKSEDGAARAYVNRLASLEFERRRHMASHGPGWHPSSPGFGDGTGSSTKEVDAMYLALLKGIVNSYWHDHARQVVKRLPVRLAIALMFSAGKIDSRNQQQEDPFARSFDHIAAAAPHYATLLGWPPGAPFVSVRRTVEQQRKKCVPPTNPDNYGAWELPPRIACIVTTDRVPMFKAGQAIKRAAHQARADLIMQAKAGVI